MAHEHHHSKSDAVNISISKKGLERIFYWIVIVVLIVLLVISYVSDNCNCDSTTNATANIAVDTSSDTSGITDMPKVAEPKVTDPILPLPTKIEVQPEPEPVPEPVKEVVPEPEPEPELSGIVEFDVPTSKIKFEEYDNKVKISQLIINVENGKTFALEGYKVLIFAYGDDEKSSEVKSKPRVEQDGFVIPSTKSGGTREMNLDLTKESIFNIVNEVVIKIKVYDDRNKLVDTQEVRKRV